jgi:hypothetical protein
MPYSSRDVDRLFDAGRVTKWYAKHGGEKDPHGFGVKAYCATCRADGVAEEEEKDKKIAALEQRLAALEQLITDGPENRDA